MRLIKIRERPVSGDEAPPFPLPLSFEEFYNDVPPYAILSHTWGPEEVSFAEFFDESSKEKEGYRKIVQASRQALRDKFEYLWVDTCCIDKRSSAELSEAINSMYELYRLSSVCYALLSDVTHDDLPSPLTTDAFPFSHQQATSSKARWLTRGWTLQELLAPEEVNFFDRNWVSLGFKRELGTCRPTELCRAISLSTNISCEAMTGAKGLDKYCVAEKMSWAAGRETSRIEDRAYSLMGLFGVNMPLLYGEGYKAFLRLQHEVFRVSGDQTLFALGPRSELEPVLPAFHAIAEPMVHFRSILAKSPDEFRTSDSIRPIKSHHNRTAPTFTNDGLSICLPVVCHYESGGCIAVLACIDVRKDDQYVGILLNNLTDILTVADDTVTMHSACQLPYDEAGPHLLLSGLSLAAATLRKLIIRYESDATIVDRYNMAKPRGYGLYYVLLDWDALADQDYHLQKAFGRPFSGSGHPNIELEIPYNYGANSVIQIATSERIVWPHAIWLLFVPRPGSRLSDGSRHPLVIMLFGLYESACEGLKSLIELSVATSDGSETDEELSIRMSAVDLAAPDKAFISLHGSQYMIKATEKWQRLHDKTCTQIQLVLKPKPACNVQRFLPSTRNI